MTPIFSWNSRAMLTASCPVSASATRSVSVGLASALTAASSAISASSICSRPAVSRISTSYPSRRAVSSARAVISTGGWPGTMGRLATSVCRATTASCSCAAGRCTSSEASSTFRFCLPRNRSASLPDVVVFAGTLQSRHHDDDGRGGGEVQFGLLRSQQFDQVIVHQLHHHLTRRYGGGDLRAQRFFLQGLHELLDHRQRHVGFQQRDADLPHRRVDVGFRQRAFPAQSSKKRKRGVYSGNRTWVSRCGLDMGGIQSPVIARSESDVAIQDGLLGYLRPWIATLRSQ